MSPERFLAGFSPEIQKIAGTLREIIKKLEPAVTERVYPGWRLLGYRRPAGEKTKYYCYIAPHADRVELGFEYGVALADPHQLLEGSGTQVRVIRFSSAREIVRRRLEPYLREAARLSTLTKEERRRILFERDADRGEHPGRTQ